MCRGVLRHVRSPSGTLGLVIGTLQLARAIDDPSLSDQILSAGIRVADTLVHFNK
jgi:hypothetical protein